MLRHYSAAISFMQGSQPGSSFVFESCSAGDTVLKSLAHLLIRRNQIKSTDSRHGFLDVLVWTESALVWIVVVNSLFP